MLLLVLTLPSTNLFRALTLGSPATPYLETHISLPVLSDPPAVCCLPSTQAGPGAYHLTPSFPPYTGSRQHYCLARPHPLLLPLCAPLFLRLLWTKVLLQPSTIMVFPGNLLLLLLLPGSCFGCGSLPLWLLIGLVAADAAVSLLIVVVVFAVFSCCRPRQHPLQGESRAQRDRGGP